MITRCQCRNFDGCERPMTQEDLRCDQCREGCNMSMGPTGSVHGHLHYRIDSGPVYLVEGGKVRFRAA